jgi:uncharacterized membrane protein (DUF4010 family)
MELLDLFQRLGVALAIGVLIGIERGWVVRKESEGERAAGLRTFALSGLLGGVSAVIALRLPMGGIVLGLSLLAHTGVITLFRYRETVADGTFGATTIVAAALTFALGALAVVSEPVVAAAAGVAATGLLALKGALHGWLRRLTWEELRAGLVLLAMTLILLPVLPDKGYGPFGALNPRELWLMTILIAAVSSAGYVAMKWVGGGHGIAISGAAGGLASSTATTLAFSRLAHEHTERAAVLTAGALIAGAVMMLRILLVAGSINAGLVKWLLLPLGFAALALGGLAAFYLRADRNASAEAPLAVKNPFELATVLKFGALLAVVMVAAKGLTHWAGSSGAYALAAVSGLADVDAVTLSMSRLAGGDLGVATSALAILLAAAVNTVAKVALGWFAGGREPGIRLAIGAGLALAAGLAGLAATWLWDPLRLLGDTSLPV